MPVLLEIKEKIGWLTLSRPERHNALDCTMKADLEAKVAELERAAGSAEIRVVVVKGAGRSFCSGADLGMLRSFSAAQARQFMWEATVAFRRLEALSTPVVAAIHGWCLGGGLELLLHCDLAIAAQDATLGFPEVSMGLTTTAGAAVRLMSIEGVMHARNMLLTAEKLTAEQAFQIGLVSRVAPSSVDFDTAVHDYVIRMASYPREGLGAIKRLIAKPLHNTYSAGWISELLEFEELLRGPSNGLAALKLKG